MALKTNTSITKDSLPATLVILGGILFNILFWNEKPGINALVFDGFISTVIFYVYKNSVENTPCKWLFAAHLATAVTLLVLNTLLSKIAFSITLLLFVSFAQYLHRSVWYAGGSAIFNYVYAIPNLLSACKQIGFKKSKFPRVTKSARIVLLPLVIAAAFIIIYASANTAFSNFAANITSAIETWCSYFFSWFSIDRFGVVILGIFITAGLILARGSNWLSRADLQNNDHLLRKKSSFIQWRESPFSDLISVVTGKPSAGILALKNESTTGLISLVLLNLLLFIVNVIDVKYVWAGFIPGSNSAMKSYVHEGAGLLILSIVLAMLLLLFFFRGNLNFYKRSKALKYAAYAWIVQNMVLVVSVLMRDNYYIAHLGLAYKRVGLLFFLVMVMAGLVTMLFKIYYTKTIYYLLRINAWVAICLLVFASAINWDVTIANYNLSRQSVVPVDVHFLLSLSDATLPLIEKNKYLLDNHFEGRSTALRFFEARKQAFIEKQINYSWLSWNVADAFTTKALETPQVISGVK